ncbi:MAG TPA: ABC transporter ATP-binding protein [Candidatus Korarchaeota archaeon]|nr:ABC transporter ATP-binding protein [Candidatus Korarchaeota archaeon]
MEEYPVIVEDVTYSYPTKENVLKHISFKVKRGEVLGIIGPNGAGKTTLCLSLNGIVPQFFGGRMSGRVIVAGMDTLEHTIAELSTKVGIVFQDPLDQLSGVATTLEEEVAFGLAMLGFPKEEIDKRVKKAIETVGLKGLEGRSPYELSGGQQQRLAIATVLAVKPEILVLDEPTAQLDPIGKFEVFETIKELAAGGQTIIVAEHEIEELATFADEIIALYDGEMVLKGQGKRVLSSVEKLKEIGVDPPSVTELTYVLRNELKISQQEEYPITLDEAVKLYGEVFK